MAITRHYNQEIIIRHMGKAPKSISSNQLAVGSGYLFAIPMVIAVFMISGFDAQGVSFAEVISTPSNLTLVALSAIIGDVLAYIFVSAVLE